MAQPNLAVPILIWNNICLILYIKNQLTVMFCYQW